MDRADAIKVLEEIDLNARMCGFLHAHKAVDMAITALREQEQREQGLLESYLKVLESPWISVKERLPENGETVLVYRPTMKTQYMTSYFWYRFCDGAIDIQGNDVITHWMPLPEPPATVAENATVSKEV